MNEVVDASEALKARVLSEAANRPSRTCPQTLQHHRVLAGAAVLGALSVFFAAGGIRPTGRPLALVALTGVGTFLLAASGTWFALSRRPASMLRRSTPAALTAVFVCTMALVAWRYGANRLFGPVSPWPGRVGWRCLLLASLTGLPSLLAMLAAWQGTEPARPGRIGASFGAGAGLCAAVLVDLWCPVSYLPHLLLGHVLPILVLAIVGGVAGALVLRLRTL